VLFKSGKKIQIYHCFLCRGGQEALWKIDTHNPPPSPPTLGLKKRWVHSFSLFIISLKISLFSCTITTMAFEIHRSRLPEDPNNSKNSNQNHRSSNDIEDVPFCIPADGIFKIKCKWDPVAKTCHARNCDALFTLPELRQAQRSWSSTSTSPPKVIISCGPERSGSTWLFNSIRLLFQNYHQPLDSYWMKTVTDKTLDDRLPGSSSSNNNNRHHVLIKTHAWSGDKFDLSRATHIFVTHRDLRQVLVSYRRMHWEYELPEDYMKDHMKWKDVATRDFSFELIIDRPRDMLLQLA